VYRTKREAFEHPENNNRSQTVTPAKPGRIFIHSNKRKVMYLKAPHSGCFFNRRVIKMLLIMKFTLILLIVCFLQAGARGFTQTLTLKFNNASLQQVFEVIEEQSDYSFVYGKEQLLKAKKVTLNVNDATIENALALLFKDQPLTYTISDRYISIREKKNEVDKNESQFEASPPFEVRGRILNDKGEPLEGITITVKGTKLGTQTGRDGLFVLNAPKSNGVLVISGVGYETKELAIAGLSNVGDIRIAATVNALDEIVVTGYSSQRKKDITGAVAVVKVSDMLAIPSPNAASQLQGRASGVTITNDNLPGNTAIVRIRGFASFSGQPGGNDPLYIIDGVPGDISSLNPSDIESIQVLKDAASGSIYGARASNGVLIVTTKKGKAGLAKVSYDAYYGYQDPGDGYKDQMLNPQGNADLVWLALKNSGQPLGHKVYGTGPTPTLPDYTLAGTKTGVMEGDPAANPDLYDFSESKLADASYTPYLIYKANKQGTDWWKVATRNAPLMNHNLSVAGGTEKGRYMFSLNYFDQKSIVRYSFFKRYTARVNSEFTIKNTIRVGENIQIYATEKNIPEGNNDETSLTGAPGQPIISVYSIKGDFAGSRGTGFSTGNPLADEWRKRNDRNFVFTIFGNAYAEVDFLKHFTARTSFGGSRANENEYHFPFIEYEIGEPQRNTTYHEWFAKTLSWTWTNQLSYKNTFGKHSVAALAGTEAVENTGRRIDAYRSEFFSYTNYDYIVLNAGTGNQSAGGSPYVSSSLYSLFGKIDYTYNNRYLASFTIRRDGSSRFGADNRYGTFPAASLGWRISEESFMKGVTWIRDLKIRGSYGTMGNQNIPPDNQYTFFSSGAGYSYYDIGGNNTSSNAGFYLGFAGNAAGKWEKNVSSNIGFDATLFRGNTEIVFDLYKKDTKDLLYPVEQPATGGATPSIQPPFFNVGSMTNKGVDLSIMQRGQFGGAKGLKFDATLTFTTYKNKITRITDGISFFDSNSPANEQNRVGGPFTRNAVDHPINSFYGYHIIGFFEDEDDVAKSPTQTDAGPGRFKYQDTDGDGVITDNDRIFFGDPNPDFSYGLNLNLAYKGFDLNVFFYGVQGKDAMNYNRWWTDFYAAFQGAKSNIALRDSWTPEHKNATVAIQEVDGNFSTNNTVNDYLLENASYFRMRNLQLGYTLPQSLLNRFKIDRIRIYVQATNLFTITKYTGLDPEIPSYDDRVSGIDLGTFPAVKQLLVGLNVNF
jgi:TonB-linked SusC/RagA family outer membrane protein